MLKELSGKKILVAPLNWGLGHATRCIPIIEQLLEQRNEVIIGSDGEALKYLENVFPELTTILIPGYDFQYPQNGKMMLAVIKQVGKVRARIKLEHTFVQQLQEKECFDIIISDNRYGVYIEGIINIFICHQLALMVPPLMQFMRKRIYTYHLSFMEPFDEIWIPDNAAPPYLSGGLAHDFPLPEKAHFIGALTRFSAFSPSPNERKQPYIAVLLSGLEPLRTLLEEKIAEQASTIDAQFVIIRGKPSDPKKANTKNIQYEQCLYGQDLFDTLYYADGIICRSGYSTILDLSVLNKKTAFIPTPGQTEQEYLAVYHADGKKCITQEQYMLDLEKVMAFFMEKYPL